MSSPVIKVENLSKQYRLGAAQGYKTFREAIANITKAPLHRLKQVFGNSDNDDNPMPHALGSLQSPDGDLIWALKDVSFDVKQGEVVGIIGRNGAGKSTLLKILSRITEPTKGRVELKGRVGSLLEVGTGFHPELTGHENIYLYGAILGMDRWEVTRKFDEIVAFAEIEKFVETPVKRYSSGMYMRLAFAVAAHLEPEILLVDEVLAVGDVAFQKKCLGKMGDVSKEGRTVFFVSHNMAAVSRLCDRSLLLDQGKVLNDGPSEKVIATYLRTGIGITAKREWQIIEKAPGNESVRVLSLRVVDTDLKTSDSVDIRKPVGIEIIFDVLEQKSPFIPQIALYNDRGVHLFNAIDTNSIWERPCKKGRYVSTAWIPGNLLNEGIIVVSAFLNTLSPGAVQRQAAAFEAISFRVNDPLEGDSAKGQFNCQWGGAVSPLLNWTTAYSEEKSTDSVGSRNIETKI
jgi:lipopolysaccharide transport system ATP-binding protein